MRNTIDSALICALGFAVVALLTTTARATDDEVAAERAALIAAEAAEAAGHAPRPAAQDTPTEPQPDPQDPDAAAGEDASIDAETLTKDFHFRPTNIRMSSDANFDQNGKITHQNHRFYVNLQATYRGRLSLSSYKNVQLTDIVTSAGERLTVDPNQNRHQGEIRTNRDDPQFGLGFNLPLPSMPCTRLELLRGTVDIVVGVGETQSAVLKPAKEYLGRTIRIREFPDSSFTLINERDSQVRVEADTALLARLSSASFYAANNTPIPSRGQGSGSRNDRQFISFYLNLPDDGAVVLNFHPEIRTITVPFELREVPLPVQDKSPDRTDMVIDLKPSGQAMAPLPENRLTLEVN